VRAEPRHPARPMKTDAPREDIKAYYLPDFCASRAVLAIVLIVELTAFVIALAGAGLLCWSSRWLKRLDPAKVSAAALAIIGSVIMVVCAVAWSVGRSEYAEALGIQGLFPTGFWPFALRTTAIGLVITALALRYFYVAHEWQRNVEMQARARV